MPRSRAQQKMGEEISEFLKMLERIIEEMDIPFASQVKEELAEFRRLVTEQRPPRLGVCCAL